MSDRLWRKKDAEGKPYGPWYATVYGRDGTRHRVSTKVFDRRAAEAAYRRLEREAHDETRSAAPRYTVSEAVEHLVELRGGESTHYSDRAKPLKRLLGHLDVNALALDDLQGYVTARRAEGVSDHTIHKEIVALKTGLRLAAKRGRFIRSIEALDPEVSAGYVPRKRHLSKDELTRLASQLEPHRLLWIAVAVFTGGRRRTEIEALELAAVDFEAATVHLPGTKTGDADRLVPLHPYLRALLEGMRDAGHRGRIVQPWGNQGRDLRAACARAGIPPVTANDLRRTFASWLIQSGVSNAMVAKLLGHTTTAMVDRVYGKHSAPALAGAVGHLPDVMLCPREPSANGVPDTRIPNGRMISNEQTNRP